MYVCMYVYMVTFGLENTRVHSKMYINHILNYLDNLPQQSVSSRRNLQVVGRAQLFRSTTSRFLLDKTDCSTW